MTDPVRLLDQGLEHEFERAFAAARSAEPPSHAANEVWQSLLVAIPTAGVLLGATTASAATGAAIPTASTSALAASSTSVLTSSAGVGLTTVAVKTSASVGLGLIAGKAIAVGLVAGLTLQAASVVVFPLKDPTNLPATSSSVLRPSPRVVSKSQRVHAEGANAAVVSVGPDGESVVGHSDVNPLSKSESVLNTVPVKPADSSDSLASPVELNVDLLREESKLIQKARQALNGARPTEALDLVREHQSRFTSGRLNQERDVLEVASLVKLGRTEEARVKALAFLARYPNSPHRERVAPWATAP
jgi:hypothetical protein